MKIIFAGILCINLLVVSVTAQNITDTASFQNKESDLQIVEISCGQCNFNLPGDDCELAIRINGKVYFVDGTDIDDHGDTHAADGFCSVIKKAHVKGTIVDNRFKLEYLKLITLAEEEKELK